MILERIKNKMNLEKVKRKIAEGYSDGEIACMSGLFAEDVAKLRAPAPAPVVKKEPAPVVKKAPAPAPKPVEKPAEK
jgi:hypothetical protein